MKFLFGKSSYVCFSVIIYILVVRFSVIGKVENKREVPAVIVFGDSIVDTGNNNYIKTIARSNFPSYGHDFMGGRPSGRFSNGKVPADLLAEIFGVKELLPPYLDPNITLDDFLSGVNFASGGSGYDDLTSRLLGGLSLEDQLTMFKEYINMTRLAIGKRRTTYILSKSIFAVCLGGNDIANTYLETFFRDLDYNIDTYTNLMIKSAKNFYESLYELGARRIGVFSIATVGCVPMMRTFHGGLERNCSESANNASLSFNLKLFNLTNFLNKKHDDLRLVYLESYSALLTILQNAHKFGIDVIDKGCCGTGLVEVGYLCNTSLDDFLCSDPSKYVFWDSYHPTETTYKILSNLIFTNDTINKFFQRSPLS